jgi:hypothetical protein
MMNTHAVAVTNRERDPTVYVCGMAGFLGPGARERDTA